MLTDKIADMIKKRLKEKKYDPLFVCSNDMEMIEYDKQAWMHELELTAKLAQSNDNITCMYDILKKLEEI